MTATLMRLPAEARGLPVTLRVSCRGDAELWQRTFGTRRLDARFVRSGTSLVECFGPLRLTYRMEEMRGALVLRLTATSASFGWFVLHLPRWLSPKVRARAYGLSDGRVRACIVAFAPWGTLLLAYHGWGREVRA
jgi:hypothetical protein